MIPGIVSQVHNIGVFCFYFYSLMESIPGVRNIAAYDFSLFMNSIASMRNVAADYDFDALMDSIAGMRKYMI